MSAPHIFHRWAKWCEPTRVDYERPAVIGAESAITFSMGWAGGPIQWTEWQQRRDCEVCGMTQIRVVE